jgi:hypothetical protein
MKAYV